jgi:uncharacterized protein YdcH (DUF465 family)
MTLNDFMNKLNKLVKEKVQKDKQWSENTIQKLKNKCN